MKKVLFFLLAVLTLTSCHFTNPSFNEEVALKQKPWFFGKTGVQDDPVNGLSILAPTTSAVTFNMLPQKYFLKFDDILSNDNTPLDLDINIILQIKRGHTPFLLRNYGEDWYAVFIEPWFRNLVRNYVSRYGAIDLMSEREVIEQFDARLKKDLQNYIILLSKKNQFPITVVSVVTGHVSPNKEQLAEMNRTASAIQQKQTEERKAEAEIARAKAERNKAIADKAYMAEMNLSPQQFIQLKWIETVASKSGANIDVMVGGGELPTWSIKK